MKTTFVIAVLAVASVTLFSCKDDDYNPIRLVKADTQTELEGNELSISIFSEGEKFLIQGGEGSYTIAISDESIADFDYDGDTLTFLPVSTGSTQSVIADHSGNSYILSISVSNPQKQYDVTEVWAKVIGSELTQGETESLQSIIVQEGATQAGGRFVLTYSEKNYSAGDIKIYPSSTGTYSVGTFLQTQMYDANTGETYQYIQVRMTDSSTYTFMLFEDTSSDSVLTSQDAAGTAHIREDVTDTYSSWYPQLSEAYRIYEVSVEQ